MGAVQTTTSATASGEIVKHYHVLGGVVETGGNSLRPVISARWSSTPPSEPGWYWWRFECYPEVVKPAELVHDRYGEKTWDFQYSIISDLTGREFWPIRMEKPPGSETRKDRE
jgi:hypothetical protein